MQANRYVDLVRSGADCCPTCGVRRPARSRSRRGRRDAHHSTQTYPGWDGSSPIHPAPVVFHLIHGADLGRSKVGAAAPASRTAASSTDPRHRIELHRQPPYSPEFNAIEGVCKTTRRTTTHNRYFGSPAERDAALRATFEQFKREPSLIEGHVLRFRAA